MQFANLSLGTPDAASACFGAVEVEFAVCQARYAHKLNEQLQKTLRLYEPPA